MRHFNFFKKPITEIESYDAPWKSSAIVNDWNVLTSEEVPTETKISNPIDTKNRFAHPNLHLAHRLSDLAVEISRIDAELTKLQNITQTVIERKDEE